MKLFTNLPGNLRALFGILRIFTVVLGVFWLLAVTFNTWIQSRFVDEPKAIVTMGEISLPTQPDAVGLRSDTAKPGSLALHSLRGSLQVDFFSQDPALISTLRLTLIPSMAAVILFAYVFFTALRNLCANLEAGRVFNEENIRFVRRIGAALIIYSLVSGALGLFSSALWGAYFEQHVVLTGLSALQPWASGPAAMKFHLSTGFMSDPGDLVTGCVVLVVAEAFRHGLKLKTENDLTV